MPKNRNMGRRAHQEQDAELIMNQPAIDAAELTNQPVRPTQHPSKSTKSSGEEPMRRHTRRSE